MQTNVDDIQLAAFVSSLNLQLGPGPITARNNISKKLYMIFKNVENFLRDH